MAGVVLVGVLAPGGVSCSRPPVDLLGGAYVQLLATATDEGPSVSDHVEVTVTLANAADVAALRHWAAAHGLSVRRDPGESWAVGDGPARRLGDAFSVEVHDFRRAESVFYAARQAPAIPAQLRGVLSGVGHILSYSPLREAVPPGVPRDVPGKSLSPEAIAMTYNVTPLRQRGFDGSGETIAVFSFGGVRQSDLDTFADRYHLPRFTPDVVAGPLPDKPSGETTMDLEIAHALAPGARTVVVNARPTAEGEGNTYVKIADLMNRLNQEVPGAVWSLSIGWGCDKLVNDADLAPVRSALAAAHLSGTTVFDASGDLAGMDCRNGQEWTAAPSDDDVGLDSVASLPDITDVGGTTLSTDASGRWLDERAWYSPVLTLGSGGGRSAVYSRPPWQMSALPVSKAPQRLTPDVSAVADSSTGLGIVLNGQPSTGGGTSQAAPLWAGMAAVMNQFLRDGGGRRLGDLNPLLYRIADGARLPAFHDITAGANAVGDAAPGYDVVTGLGTPDVANLAKDVLDLQRSLR